MHRYGHHLRITLVQGLCLGLFFFHPPYSLDLAPSDIHLFTRLKKFLSSTCVSSDEEVKMVKDWFNGLAADFYDAGIETHHTVRQVPESSWGLCRKMIYDL
jgi:hypothetical protein